MEGLTATISLTFDPTHPGEAGRVLDTLSFLATELHKRGVTPVVLSPDPPPGDPLDDPDLDPAPPPPDPGTQTAQAPPKRVRDRTAERRAAKEKADAEAKAAQADDPLLGAGGGPGTGDPFGDDTDDDAPLPPGPDAKPAEPVERVRTPKECMDGSIVLLRQCFAQGGADAVKALQKTYKVSKFIDLPLDAAPGLWKQSLDLARTLQIKIPPGL
jgi:hypothetical protein